MAGWNEIIWVKFGIFLSQVTPDEKISLKLLLKISPHQTKLKCDILNLGIS